MSKTEAVTCPNCGEPAHKMIRDGKTYILCEAEDRVYELTATGAKARQRGRLDDIERRLAALEGRPAEPKHEPHEQVKDDNDDDEEEDGPSIEIVFGGDDEDEEDDADGETENE